MNYFFKESRVELGRSVIEGIPEIIDFSFEVRARFRDKVKEELTTFHFIKFFGEFFVFYLRKVKKDVVGIIETF